jgi:hypothetical protein
MKRLKVLLSLAICLIVIIILAACAGNAGTNHYKDSYIKYDAVKVTSEEKHTMNESIKRFHEQYDPEVKMIADSIYANAFFHTDASRAIFHKVRESFYYAVDLLDLGDKQYTQRAFDVIEKTISIQDQDPNSKSYGVWPYYMEEPLATKKASIDYNWADFNAVSLLDVWMGHQEEIPAALKPTIKNSIILAAKAVQKRNCGSGYTNIAIMGTYVTYMVSHLFDLPEMKEYAQKRLKTFYDYTLDKGGFSEYNSPTYSIVALDELYHMKIVEPSASQMIDSLYSIGWEMIARHYHQPTGQWAGPHSRSYSTPARASFYAILSEASNGKIVVGTEEKRRDVKIKHQIPEYLLHYFLSPEYPRTETDVFEKVEPQVIGTCYMTDKYAISTANRSSLWTQRRPFLAYWGNIQTPKYLQVRFLHDDYDFSSASFYSQQKENKVLAGINFISNGGDKHISVDRLKEGIFVAKDLRLRFEFGNVKSPEELSFPALANEPFSITLDNLKFNLQLCYAMFEKLKGHWEKGGNGKNSWIDFVLYSGPETEFDLTKINVAALSFTFSLGSESGNIPFEKPSFSVKDKMMDVKWDGLNLLVAVKPGLQPKNL